jgi:hypothetical protein
MKRLYLLARLLRRDEWGNALLLSQFCNMFSPKYAIVVLTVIALVKKLTGHVAGLFQEQDIQTHFLHSRASSNRMKLKPHI